MRIKNWLIPPSLSWRVSCGLFLLRVVVGLAFVFHGWGKIQHPFTWMGPDSKFPGVLQLLGAVSEFGGGFAWMLGVLTPLAALGIACTMSVAVWMHAVVFGDPFAMRQEGGAYEPALVYLSVAILLLLAGPGRFSMDNLLFRRRASP